MSEAAPVDQDRTCAATSALTPKADAALHCIQLIRSPNLNFTLWPKSWYPLRMDTHTTAVTPVYYSRLLAWSWAVALPIGIYALTAKLLQSLGIYMPFFSEPEFPIGWGTRLVVGVILIVWLRGAPGIIARVRSSNAILLVSDHGVEIPGAWSLKWPEIDRIANHFGTLKFIPKDSSLPPIDFFPPNVTLRDWRNAKSRNKRCAPEALTKSI